MSAPAAPGAHQDAGADADAAARRQALAIAQHLSRAALPQVAVEAYVRALLEQLGQPPEPAAEGEARTSWGHSLPGGARVEQGLDERSVRHVLDALITATSLARSGWQCAPGDFLGSISVGSERVRCGHVFQRGELVYRCQTCGTDNTCVMCHRCFVAEREKRPTAPPHPRLSPLLPWLAPARPECPPTHAPCRTPRAPRPRGVARFQVRAARSPRPATAPQSTRGTRSCSTAPPGAAAAATAATRRPGTSTRPGRSEACRRRSARQRESCRWTLQPRHPWFSASAWTSCWRLCATPCAASVARASARTGTPTRSRGQPRARMGTARRATPRTVCGCMDDMDDMTAALRDPRVGFSALAATQLAQGVRREGWRALPLPPVQRPGLRQATALSRGRAQAHSVFSSLKSMGFVVSLVPDYAALPQCVISAHLSRVAVAVACCAGCCASTLVAACLAWACARRRSPSLSLLCRGC